MGEIIARKIRTQKTHKKINKYYGRKHHTTETEGTLDKETLHENHAWRSV